MSSSASRSGFRYRDMELEDGVLLAVVEAQCRYLYPARFDEEVIVETRIAEANSAPGELRLRNAPGGRRSQTRHRFDPPHLLQSRDETRAPAARNTGRRSESSRIVRRCGPSSKRADPSLWLAWRYSCSPRSSPLRPACPSPSLRPCGCSSRPLSASRLSARRTTVTRCRFRSSRSSPPARLPSRNS